MCFATSACSVVCVGSWRTYAPAVAAAVAMSAASPDANATPAHTPAGITGESWHRTPMARPAATPRFTSESSA